MRVSRRENLDRYYLFQWRGYGVFLHRIHHDEKPNVYHTHPWSWVSIVFGRYLDHRLMDDVTRKVFGLNWCRAGEAHRVTLPNGPVWSICIHGKRQCQWKVVDSWGRVLAVEPWRGIENPDRRSYFDGTS